MDTLQSYDRRPHLAGQQKHFLDRNIADASATETPPLIYPAIKRAMDVVGSMILLVILCPVFLLLALAVRADGGPIIFTHSRVGIGGRQFGCLKFRSMRIGAQHELAKLLAENQTAREEWKTYHKLRNDPRVTALGKIMRPLSLDELPQLINVLRGEMSLVGPRPVKQVELDLFYEPLDGATAYLSIRPGITGLWQVSGRNSADYETRVSLDKAYIKNVCFRADIIILMRTLVAVIVRTGAY